MVQLSAAAAASQSRMCASVEHGGHVRRGGIAHLRAVGAEAQHHGRVHRIGRRCIRRTARDRRAEARAAIVPQFSMRAISAERSGFGAVLRPVARAFMGHCERRIEKPACISAHTARAMARAARSCGQPRPASSQAYSQIASESHTSSDPCCRTGTRRVGLKARDVARELRRCRAASRVRRTRAPGASCRIHGAQRPR